MTRTILTIAQQQKWCSLNHTTLVHKWSTRGYGNSRILQGAYSQIEIARAGGCGYDRYGAALGKAIMTLFPKEVHKLAKRECKGKRRDYKKSEKFYGLFYDAKRDHAWLDGACGTNCMERILNKIGFTLAFVGQTERTNNGEQFYEIRPLSKNHRRWLEG